MPSYPFPWQKGAGGDKVQTPTSAQSKTEQELETPDGGMSWALGMQGGKQSPGTVMDGRTAPKHLAKAHLTITSRGVNWVGKYPLFVRHTLIPQKQGGASWRLVLFYPNLPCDAAVYAQQGALSPDDTTCSTSYTSQSHNTMVVQTGETSFRGSFMKLVWNKFSSVYRISLTMKMKFHLMATSSLVLQRSSGLLHSYLTDSPKRSQKRVGVSVI